MCGALNVRETVAVETPAAVATSIARGARLVSLRSLWGSPPFRAPQTRTFDLQFAGHRPQFDPVMAFVRKRFAADRALSVLGHTGLNLLIYDHLLHLFQDQLAFEVRFLPLNRRPTPLFADKS